MDARNQAGATAAQEPSRAMARARYVRVTPMKARRVVELVRAAARRRRSQCSSSHRRPPPSWCRR